MKKKPRHPDAHPTKHRRLNRPGHVLFWMLGLSFLLYLPQLGGEFIFDDVHYVQHNPFLANWDTLIHWNQFLRSRPLYWLSFFVQKQMWGTNPTGYKIVSMLAHGLSAFFLYLAMVRLLSLKKLAHPWLPLVSGFLFLVSPVTTEAVCYISGQNNGIGGLFFIASIWKLLQAMDPAGASSRRRRIVQATLLMIAAFLFKEVYLVGFLMLPALTLWIAGPSRKTLLLSGCVLLAVILLSVLATFTLDIQPFPKIRRGLAGKNHYRFTEKAIATNMSAAAYALKLSIFPDKLNIDHDLPVIDSVTDPRTLGALAFLAGLAVILFLLRKRLPLAFPSFLTWLLLIAPTNSVILRHGDWMVDPLSERNLYAPAMAIAVLLAHLLITFFRSDKARRWVAIALILAFGIRTIARTVEFRNNITLWTASVRWSPDRARPHYNLAVALSQAGLPEDALPHARKAVQLSPESHCFGLLANIYRNLKDPTRAESTLKRGLRKTRKRKYLLMSQLGQFYYERGQFRKAARHLRNAIKARPRLILPRITLAYILLTDGNIRQAGRQLSQLEEMMRKQDTVFRPEEIITPRHRALLAFGRGWYLLETGREDAGIRSLKLATTTDPGFVEPYLKLGEYYYRKRRYTDAWNWFLRASRLREFGRYRNQAGPYLRNLPKLLENPDLDPGF